MNEFIQLTSTPLDPEACREWVAEPSAGGQVIFCGAVRNHTKGEVVTHLFYEAYEPMALIEMKRISEKAIERWPLVKTCVHHRLGTLQIGELAVIIAVSAAHRQAAFEACMFMIDELKKDVPIWKKEFLKSGAQWVSDRP